jgi:hypothetical protein
MGGLSWIFGVVLTTISLPIAILLYENQESDPVILSRAKRSALLVTVPTLICFIVLMFSINRQYLNTFFSLKRGKDLAVQSFRAARQESSKGKNAMKDMSKIIPPKATEV